MIVHFIIHEGYEAPGAYAAWASSRGHSIESTRLYAGEQLPTFPGTIDLLVVLGGPQKPSTLTRECPHFDAFAEKKLIKACIDKGCAVVGICLGAQLIGEALGTRFEQSPHKEIGNFPITLTEAGKQNPKFAHLGAGMEVGHWHGDMPGLTADAKIIAYSKGCPRQIVEYSDLVYGLQCHMEFNRAVVEELIEADSMDWAALVDSEFVQQPCVLRSNRYEEMNEGLFGFLDKLMDAYAA
jgi:GMP synthase (glutamine-hydrolysing)